MIKIAISTNINFHELSLPIVLESLISSGIEKKDIYVFNAGFPNYEKKIIDEITYFYLNHNSFEYSPLIEIVEKELESEYWFLIHDTCKVGPKFKELLYNIPEHKPQKLAIRSQYSMSIGSYKYSYLLSEKEKIISIKNTDMSHESLIKWKNWGVENEDFILHRTEPKAEIYNNIDSWSLVCHENWYNSNTIRRTEYFPALDLYKNKSNWGQTDGSKMVLNI
jgi:hypothetical protein